MVRSNPISDAMTAIKNASDTGKADCIVEPAGKLLGSMLRIMQEAGYIGGFEFIDDNRGGQFRVQLNGRINRCGAITPRFNIKITDLENWESQFLPGKNFGMLIISTPKGVMTHDSARRLGIGGELLGYVY